MTIRVPRAFLVILAIVVAAGIGAAIALLASDNGDGSGDKVIVTAATQVEDKDSSSAQIRRLCQKLLQSTKVVRYSRSSGTTPVDELRELAARLNAAAAAIKAVRASESEGAELVQSLEGASESAREAARNGGDSAPLLGALAAAESVSASLGLGDACTVHVIPTP